MKKKLLFLLLLLIGSIFNLAAQTGTGSMLVNGATRTYTYYLPSGFDINCSYPLLIVYHGSGGTGAGIKSYAGFDAVADAEKFVAVYPDGTCSGNEWNTNCVACVNDDILFTQQLTAKFNTDFNINLSRVYAAGHSNGGFFINYACSQNSSLFAARAVVAGNLCGWWWPPLTAGIPYLHIHSINDPVVQYIDNPPADGINDWPVGDYFASFPDVACIGYNINLNFVIGADKITYNSCQNDNEVVLIRSSATSHAWNIGVPALNTAQEIWDFVSQYDNVGKNQYVPPTCSTPNPIANHHIKIDQFGYPTWASKIAVISMPQTGYNSPDSYVAGTAFEVRKVSDNSTVFSGNATNWNSGNTDPQSGDKVKWFDFSSVTTNGSYYIYDVTNNEKSYAFEINDCVYETVLKTVARTFYYQRCGMPKDATYANTKWEDATACHVGTLQDTDCRLYNNPIAATSKDLSGGWHDAGDYNKYTTFTYSTLNDLLLAYYENPSAWGDDYNIPESGNGIPDILDEIKYELNWLLKMQQTDGGVLSVVGVLNFPAAGSPPSTDTPQRYYGPATTAATLTAAAVFALAANMYQIEGNTTLNAYAQTLKTAAIKAWKWANNNTNVTFYNQSVQLAAGENEPSTYERDSRKLAAACYLYALTDSTAFKTFFENNYNNAHLLQWTFVYPFENPLQDALLFYTRLPNITTSVKNNIITAYSNSMQLSTDNLPAFTANTDPYRAFLTDQNYTWGSNETKAHNGLMYLNMLSYNLNATNATNYRNAGLGYLHYLHGVNPVNYCYLSNTSSLGAENSVPTLYHSWFKDGSIWDEPTITNPGPPAGFLPGGANPSYAPNPICSCTVAPPQNQPIQKSYYAWNDSNWQVESWEISEIGIYQQAAYLKLLSKIWGINTNTCGGCVIPAVISSSAPIPNACVPFTQTYTANKVVGATYSWTISAGGTIQSGQNTNSITVLWNNTGSNNVQVTIARN